MAKKSSKSRTDREAATPVTMLCTYRPKRGKDAELLALVRAHWPALSGAGLASEMPPQLFRATDRRGRTAFVELFQWRDARAAEEAHGHPEVLAIWEPMDIVAADMDFAELELLVVPEVEEGEAKAAPAGPRKKPTRATQPAKTAEKPRAAGKKPTPKRRGA